MDTRIINTTTQKTEATKPAPRPRVYSPLKRSLQILKEHSLNFLLYRIIHKLSLKYLVFLNRMKLLATRKRYLVKEVLGSKMYLDLTDKGICQEIFLDGIREPLCVEMVRREVKKGDAVIDIGANIGYYVLLESQLVGETGKVYAIEPVPSNIQFLRKNIELNGYSNIELYQCAIGETNGYHSMYITEQCNRSTLRDVAGTNKEKYVTNQIDVEVVQLDEFTKEKIYPKLIRMDVEGYEYQIIRGMKNILQQKLPLTIIIEFHFHLLHENESIEILELLKNAGFRIDSISSEVPALGRRQHSLLSRIINFTEREIGQEINIKPHNRYLNLSIDEIIANPVILSGQWGDLHIFFKRD